MTAELCTTVDTVYHRVLQQMAFLFAEDGRNGETGRVTARGRVAHMSFSGGVNGTMALAVPTGLCHVIAANVLGVSEDDERISRYEDDAAKELLNVLCGNLVAELAPEAPVELGIPHISRLDAEGWKRLKAHSNTRSFLVGDFPTLVCLSLDD